MSIQNAKILLVEDDVNHRFIVEDLLCRRGWEVVAAPDAHQAFLAAREFKPDVLVADWVLPDKITGGVLAALLRGFLPRLHLVFISGLLVADLEVQARDLAPCVFIQKPYNPGELVSAIERQLSETQPRDTQENLIPCPRPITN